MTLAERRRVLKPRPALQAEVDFTVQYRQMIGARGEPRVELRTQQLEGLVVGYDQRTVEQRPFGLDLAVRVSQPGVRFFPPAVPTRALQRPSLTREQLRQNPLRLAGYVPDHLPFHPTPAPLEAALQRPKYFDALAAVRHPDAMQATTVFAPDNRRVFSDTSYPWGTVGRVDTANGQASGTMIGPRHVLTVSHTIVWNSDGTAGWLTFSPAYFDGPGPFGAANAIQVYFYNKVTGPSLDSTEQRLDYVVVVLDQRLGDVCGWMGTRSYDDGWDGLTVWDHIGYPGDLTAGNRPSFQNSISLDGFASQDDSHERMDHQGDVWPGQSGGPFFSWWSGDPFPYAVAVQSGQTASINAASGGSYIPHMVNQARSDFP